MILSPVVGPYMGAVADAVKTVKLDGRARHFRVVAYTAYNAMGLIGSECHGLVVLDEDEKSVIADEIGCGAVGYPALDPGALLQYHALFMAQTGRDFRAAVNGARRLRKSI